jgi:aminopeptidase
MNAIGGGAAGAFSNCKPLYKKLQHAGALTGDRVWEFPLWDVYTKNVSNYSRMDLSNTGTGKGNSCLAAAFLREFVRNIDWIHMDITGVGMMKNGLQLPYMKHGKMTGRPTRTLVQFLQQFACPEKNISPEIKC